MTLANLTAFIEGRRDQHLAELTEFLRIPSISAKSEHKPDIERGARWVADHLRDAGFKTVQIVPTNLHPLVYAESLLAPGQPTILFYGHYNVQPPEPLELWTSPAFEPTVRDGNLFGRGPRGGTGAGQRPGERAAVGRFPGQATGFTCRHRGSEGNPDDEKRERDVRASRSQCRGANQDLSPAK